MISAPTQRYCRVYTVYTSALFSMFLSQYSTITTLYGLNQLLYALLFQSCLLFDIGEVPDGLLYHVLFTGCYLCTMTQFI